MQYPPVTLAAAADACGATRRHKERQAAYAADRATWQALIASWLAPPAGPLAAITTGPQSQSTTSSSTWSRRTGSPPTPAHPLGRP
jgi:hypothetical protein